MTAAVVDDGCSWCDLTISALGNCHSVSVDSKSGGDCVVGLDIDEVDLLGCRVSNCYRVAINDDAFNVVTGIRCN